MNSAAKTLMVLALAGMTLSACGNGGNTTNQMSTQTLGQELADLERAYAGGLLTEKEYNEQRKKLLKK